MSIFDFAKANEQYIISMRREFHRHPELSGKEERTVTRICEELSKMGAAHVNVPQGGVLAFFGDEAAGPTVLLRADIDAVSYTHLDVYKRQPSTCTTSPQ